MTTEIQPVYAGGAAVVRGRPQLDIGLHARLRRGSCVERRDGLRRRLAGATAPVARAFFVTRTRMTAAQRGQISSATAGRRVLGT